MWSRTPATSYGPRARGCCATTCGADSFRRFQPVQPFPKLLAFDRTDLRPNCEARVDSALSFEPAAVGRPLLLEEIEQTPAVANARLFERLDRMPQFMADRGDHFPGCVVGVDIDSQHPIGTSHRDRQEQAGVDAVPALAFLDEHNAICCVDCCHKLLEGG